MGWCVLRGMHLTPLSCSKVQSMVGETTKLVGQWVVDTSALIFEWRAVNHTSIYCIQHIAEKKTC